MKIVDKHIVVYRVLGVVLRAGEEYLLGTSGDGSFRVDLVQDADPRLSEYDRGLAALECVLTAKLKHELVFASQPAIQEIIDRLRAERAGRCGGAPLLLCEHTVLAEETRIPGVDGAGCLIFWDDATSRNECECGTLAQRAAAAFCVSGPQVAGLELVVRGTSTRSGDGRDVLRISTRFGDMILGVSPRDHLLADARTLVQLGLDQAWLGAPMESLAKSFEISCGAWWRFFAAWTSLEMLVRRRAELTADSKTRLNLRDAFASASQRYAPESSAEDKRLFDDAYRFRNAMVHEGEDAPDRSMTRRLQTLAVRYLRRQLELGDVT